MQNIIDRQKDEISKLQAEIDALRDRIRDPEMTNILECRQQVKDCQEMVSQKGQENLAQARGCRTLVAQAEEKGRYKGMLAIWESLSISATPSEEGLLFKDHYLTVNVNVRKNSVYSFRLKTAGTENPFVKALSTAADAVTIAKYIK